MQDNLEYLGGKHDFLIKNVIQLEDDLKKTQQDKIDLENQSNIIDNVYGHECIAQFKQDMSFNDSAVSTSKIKPISVERNQNKKKELVKTFKITKDSQAPPSAKVHKVIPFDVYKY